MCAVRLGGLPGHGKKSGYAPVCRTTGPIACLKMMYEVYFKS